MTVYTYKLTLFFCGHLKLTCVPGTAATPKGGLIMGCANMTGC